MIPCFTIEHKGTYYAYWKSPKGYYYKQHIENSAVKRISAEEYKAAFSQYADN